MAYLRNVPRSEFFKELSKEKQKEFFNLKGNKYLPTIDNIYYSAYITDDSEENKNVYSLIDRLDMIKEQARQLRQAVDYGHGLQMELKSYSMYKYCLSQPDLYDIFILGHLPTEDTPRILVQLRAHGLWTHNADEMLTRSFYHVSEILGEFGLKIEKCRESRIDYCYHTNIINNPEKVLSDENVSRQMRTTFSKWRQMGEIEKTENGTVLHKDYFSLGERSSNYVFARIYNKTKEVIEQGYKNFFFELWHKSGLINAYDKFCFEYAIEYKNMDYVHKAKLVFYMNHGTDESRKAEYKAFLDNPNTTLAEFKALARSQMPEVTKIMNIEFETKRKFYYYSDKFIKHLKYIPRPGLPEQLTWLFRIIDNRAVFLDYLTSKTLCFKESEDEYTFWWERLRNTKLGGNKADEKLLREYSQNLDERLTRVKIVNAVATNAVYNDNVTTDFISDVSDMLSNLNDNDAQRMKAVIQFQSEEGQPIDCINCELLEHYRFKKLQKNQRLKNRKKIKADVFSIIDKLRAMIDFPIDIE